MSEVQPPLVSVIIPAYNREKYIVEAIDSVLAQEYAPIELIVVDDGSTDRTAEIVQNYGDQLVYLCQQNQGAAAARNSGIAYAHGEFLAFLDSDDIWAEGKLSWQMALLQQNPHLDAVYGQAEQFFSPDADEVFKARTKIPRKIIPSYISCAMLIRRKSFDLVGLFDTQFAASPDIDWYARAQEAGLVSEMLPEVVYYRRVHPANATSQNENANLSRLRVLKPTLD